MNDENMPRGAGDEPSPEEIMSALFANMVIQNHNMAAMFLGRTPHPQTGQPVKDLESAQMFVDQLEMLAYKTRGNLSNEEKQLLNQSLTQLRMVFVEELRREGIPVPEHLTAALSAGASPALAPGPAAAAEAVKETPPSATGPAPAQPAAAPAAPAPPAQEEESRKKFTKKY